MEFESAIIIVAPHEVQTVAVPILRRYLLDELLQVPPHITLLYPFAAFVDLYEATTRVRKLCASVPTFEITLDGYGEFPGAIFMNLADPAPVKSLFQTLSNAFPQYPPYGGRFGPDLHPHLTVAQFEDESEQQAAFKKLPKYPPLTFTVMNVHVIYGASKSGMPWITYDVIPLGANLYSAPDIA
jgi:2'-5' RNA ligase